MGIRPFAALVFGIDDHESAGRIDDEVWESSVLELDDEPGSLPDLYLQDLFKGRDGHWKLPYEIIFDGSRHEADVLTNVFGLILRESYNDDLWRALTVLHPEYMEPGYRDIPAWDPKEHPIYKKRALAPPYNVADISFQFDWFYPSVIEPHHMWPVYAYCARYAFRRVGVEIDPYRYKLMLVWNWE